MSRIATQILVPIVAEAMRHVGRSEYAKDVLASAQNWSGSDLQGAAKAYGGHYKAMRRRARFALEEAGGRVLATEHGRLVSAVRVCVDDYGHEVYATYAGFKRVHTAAQLKAI